MVSIWVSFQVETGTTPATHDSECSIPTISPGLRMKVHCIICYGAAQIFSNISRKETQSGPVIA